MLAYKLLHVSGDHEAGEYPLPTSGTPQAIGSAITYARRYTLVAVTGLAPEDDDDGAAAEAERAGQRGTSQRAAPARRQAPAREPAPDRPTAQRARGASQAQLGAAERLSGPALPGEVDQITPPQQRMMMALFNKVGMTERADRLQYVNEILTEARMEPVESSADLTKAGAKKVLDKLIAWTNEAEGAPDA